MCQIFVPQRRGCSRVIFILCFLILACIYSSYPSRVSSIDKDAEVSTTTSIEEEIKKAIEEAAKEEYPASVRDSITLGQVGQVKYVIDYFKNKTGGVFLETGAYDGVEISNTLYLEATLGWTGLLIEPNKLAYAALRQNKRKASSLNVCLSPTSSPTKVIFEAAEGVGSIKSGSLKHDLKDRVPPEKKSEYELQCYPIYDIILAAGLTSIDFWSLDIEGFEEDVLDTVPWHKVNIKSILIEVEHSDRDSILSKLQAQGYRIHKEFGKQDVFLVKD